MSTSDWHSFTGVEPARLREARLQAHFAAQWLARLARAHVAPRANDEHTNLGWDDGLGGFATHAIANGDWLGLQLAGLKLTLIGRTGEPSQVFSLDGRTDAEARAWLGQHVDARGMDMDALDAPSPYEMPAHAIARGGRYDAKGLAAALAELTAWYANAVGALTDARRQFIDRYPRMSPLRCWPHHFDLDTVLALGVESAEPTASVGVGFSPGDDYYDEPYFYVTVHPAPDVATLPGLPALGLWHTADFTAAIAPANRILKAKDRRAEVGGFLRSAIDAAISALS